ncbi:MAG TPA: sterol desaturase family protein [Pyrinomonadaceae bacterium]|nr:sterol desaturase family protein [Pyrinomonadaceae bacterium]
MQALLTDQVRLLALVGVCGLLWSLESIAPLYHYQKGRVRHAFPNVALAVLLVLTNLALSFSSAYWAGFTVRYGLGLFPFLGISVWAQAVLGIVVLDLFGYFSHVLLHKSWLGWQFHRGHHSESLVDVITAFRQHPGETVWRLLCQLTAIVVFGIPLWIVINGLDGFDIKERQTLRGLLKMPFVSYRRG